MRIYFFLIIVSIIISSCNDFTDEDLYGEWNCVGNTLDKERTGFAVISFNDKNEISIYFPDNVFFGKYEVHDNNIYCELNNADEYCRLEVISFNKKCTGGNMHCAHGRMYLKMYLDNIFFMGFDCMRQ